MSSKYCKKTDPTYKEIVERPEAPFSDDLLGMGEVASGMATIISNTDGPFVFNINSPYGTGKTFFMTRLRALLEREFGHRTVYFNAWEFDFYKNPLVSIVAELQEHFEANPIKEPEKAGVISQIKDQTIGLVKKMDFSFSLEGKITDPNTGLVYSVKPALSTKTKESASGNVKKDIFEEYKDFKKLKEEFVTSLSQFLINEEKPLIFFIDELDRCRPDYAIEVLETIKHFFPVKNIIFVLAVDRAQIESTVRTLFGCNTTTEYLKKFIDQDFYFPVTDNKKYICALCNIHLRDIITSFSPDENSTFYLSTRYSTTDEVENILMLISTYVQAFSGLYAFSLRTQEQLIIFIKMFFKTIKGNNRWNVLIPDLVVILSSIRFFNPIYLEKMHEYSIRDLTNKNIIISKLDTTLKEKDINTFWMDNMKPLVFHTYPNKRIKPVMEAWSYFISYSYAIKKNPSTTQFDQEYNIIQSDILQYGKIVLDYIDIIKKIGQITKVK